ncbi:hypothetical protein HK101_004381 [Irineochytrium annulatum]|nr:hypothetical protein HK101_004381 [Irineochytrium annulatum]
MDSMSVPSFITTDVPAAPIPFPFPLEDSATTTGDNTTAKADSTSRDLSGMPFTDDTHHSEPQRQERPRHPHPPLPSITTITTTTTTSSDSSCSGSNSGTLSKSPTLLLSSGPLSETSPPPDVLSPTSASADSTNERHPHRPPVREIPPKTLLFALDESLHSVSSLRFAMDFMVKDRRDTLIVAAVVLGGEDKDAVSYVSLIWSRLGKDWEVGKGWGIRRKWYQEEGVMWRVRSLVRAVWEESVAPNIKIGFRVMSSGSGGDRSVGPKLCKLCDEIKPDVLILGSAGKSHFKGLLMGSVSTYCIRKARWALNRCSRGNSIIDMTCECSCPVVVARLQPAYEQQIKAKVGSPLSPRRSTPSVSFF